MLAISEHQHDAPGALRRTRTFREQGGSGMIYDRMSRTSQPRSGGSKSLTLLESNLTRHALQEIEIPKDGNCLFHSLASWMDGVDHLTIRKIIIEWIEMHTETFEQDILASGYSSVQDYCRRMSRPGEWGDAIMLQAFILLTHVNIRLFTDYGFTDLNPGGIQNLAIVQHQHHYQPALPV